MFPVVPGKKGRDTMGFTDKNVVVPEWGGLCAKEYRKSDRKLLLQKSA